MDWTRYLVRVPFQVSLLFLAAACRSGSHGDGRALGPWEHATTHARGMSEGRVLGADALAYQVALTTDDVVSVELTTHFELVLRARPGSARQKNRRIYLDTPTYDVNALVINATGTRAIVASSAGWVRTYDLEQETMLSEWRMGSGATALALGADQDTLLIGTESGVVCLRRLRDGAQLQCLAAHAGRVSALAVRGQLLASASWKGELSLWELPSLRALSSTEARGSIADLSFSGAGDMLAVARNRKSPVRTQALTDAEQKNPYVDPVGANVIELHVIHKNEFTADAPKTLQGHRSIISSLSWVGPDLVSASWDRSVQVWNTAEGYRTLRRRRFKHIVCDVASSPTGNLVFAGWGSARDAPAIFWTRLLY